MSLMRCNSNQNEDVVLKWVRIAFSAATGAEFAEHDILSWSFHSDLMRIRVGFFLLQHKGSIYRTTCVVNNKLFA
ncbi:lectin [Trifolium medium]|uniref:Lectin n=1 Tax=Trifolium medium TaxID=97028 RepID=A0A392RAP7_9FABA|nr:lectin [Trifolium medium]